jgi:hypothetical protein
LSPQEFEQHGHALPGGHHARDNSLQSVKCPARNLHAFPGLQLGIHDMYLLGPQAGAQFADD